MRDKKHFAIIIVALLAAAPLFAQAQDKPDAKIGACIFSTKPVDLSKKELPKNPESLKCGDFDVIYAVCEFTQPLGAVGTDSVRVAINIPPFDKPFVYEIESATDTTQLERMDFRIPDKNISLTMDALCKMPGEKGLDRTTLGLDVSAGRLAETKTVTETDKKTGKEVSREVKTYAYTPVASGRIDVVTTPHVKPLEIEELKNALRDYWPMHYTGDAFVDAMFAGDVATEPGKNYTTYRFPLTVIGRSATTGNQYTCSVHEAEVQRFNTGSLYIALLNLDLTSDCM